MADFTPYRPIRASPRVETDSFEELRLCPGLSVGDGELKNRNTLSIFPG